MSKRFSSVEKLCSTALSILYNISFLFIPSSDPEIIGFQGMT